MPARRVWVVRAGRGAVYAEHFLDAGVVAIDLGMAEPVEGLSADELITRRRKIMPDESPVARGLAAGALTHLASDLAIGDVVLTPEQGGSLLVGEVTGPYRFEDAPIVGTLRHTRPVRWFGRLQRAALPEGIRNSLGSIMTLFAPRPQQELLGLVEPLAASTVPPTPLSMTAGAPVQKPGRLSALPVPVPVPEDPAPPSVLSGSRFETDKRDLLFLLDLIENRELALPDFQRSFVWDPLATRELLVSIIRFFPAGNLLFLQGGSAVFLPRAVEGAPMLKGSRPSTLILDGQQRLSSLYQAFKGVGTHRFFVDVAALMAGDDIDGAVKAFSENRATPWATIEGQARSLMLPLSRVRQYSYWRDEVLDHRIDDEPEDRRRLRSYLNAVETAVIAPIRAYQFPVTTLSERTPTEAVCTIFETLNRTGIKLSVFELICARAFAEGHRLRERWQQSLTEHAVLKEFGIDPYYLLQAIALRVGKKPQRGIVAALEVSTLVDHWDAAARGMAEGLRMLRDECGVLTARWLPYAPMLPTLAAAWRDVDEANGPAAGARRLKLQRWFWASSFEGEYDNAPNSRAEADIPQLHAWLCGGPPPRVVAQFEFDPATLVNVTVRQRGLYRATMALLMRRQPLDFFQAVPLTRAVIETNAVDDHHVFPVAYLKEHAAHWPDTVLNHTLIDQSTNVRIGKKAPSVYLAQMENELGTSLAKILESHGLPLGHDGPLWRDDYDAFLHWRIDHINQELCTAVGVAAEG